MYAHEVDFLLNLMVFIQVYFNYDVLFTGKFFGTQCSEFCKRIEGGLYSLSTIHEYKPLKYEAKSEMG